MGARFDISPVASQAEVADAARLFAAYAAGLPVALDYQDFDGELAGLPGKYAAPAGAILLARDEAGKAIGCVGIRPAAAPHTCELKRLYTLAAARGSGLGRALTAAAIGFARGAGYVTMQLDTLPTMTAAIDLYRQLGFAPCPPYYAPTPPGTLFMTLKL